jgi:uncharacterized membrane protein
VAREILVSWRSGSARRWRDKRRPAAHARAAGLGPRGPVEAFGPSVRNLLRVSHAGRVGAGGRAPGAILGPVIERMSRPSLPLAILLVVGGVVGLIAAFALTLDKFAILENPDFVPSCNFSVLIGCSKNLNSPVGSAFGFPNPLLGLMMFPAPLIVGVASIAGVRFPRWFWALFNVGMAFAIGFVIYLISNSIFNFDLRVLCPWCMAVWAVVIPMSLGTTLYNLREHNLPLGDRAARVAGALYGWMPILTLVCYVIFAVVAQINLDVLGNLF